MESARELMGAARLCERLLDDLTEKRERAEKEHRNVCWHVEHEVYGDQIRALQNRLHDDLDALNEAHAGVMAEMSARATELCVPIKRLRRVLEFFRLKKFDLAVSPEALKPRRSHQSPYKEDLGLVVDEEFLKIRLLILENEKPVNKYSLMAYGRCLFHDEQLRLARDYTSTCFYESGLGLQVERRLKDAPRVAELKAYAEKKRDEIAALKGDYDAVAAEYREVMASYTLEDFAPMIEWRCECGHFWTVFDHVSYSPGKPPACLRCEGEMRRGNEEAQVDLVRAML